MSKRRRSLKARRRAEAARPPRPEAKRCKVTGKLGYATREDAVAAMASFSRAKRFKGQRIYPCEHCDRYHATSQIRK